MAAPAIAHSGGAAVCLAASIMKEQARCLKSENVRPLKGHYLRKPGNYD
jgi:hypothetical protein